MVETLEPPTMAINGRCGLFKPAVKALTSSAISKPMADGNNFGAATIEAWARCAVENASET